MLLTEAASVPMEGYFFFPKLSRKRMRQCDMVGNGSLGVTGWGGKILELFNAAAKV